MAKKPRSPAPQDERPSCRSPYSVEDLLGFITGKQATADAQATMVVLYCHALLDDAITRYLFACLCSHRITPVELHLQDKPMSTKQAARLRDKAEDRIYEKVNGISFRQKMELFLACTAGHFDSSRRAMESINTVRNHVAHCRNLSLIQYERLAITSPDGLEQYFGACQSLFKAIQKFQGKNIDEYETIREAMYHYFADFLDQRSPRDVYIAIRRAYEKAGKPLPWQE